MVEEERPPVMAWLVDRGERIAAVVLLLLVVGGSLYVLNRSSPPDVAYMGEAVGILFWPAMLGLVITVGAYLLGMGFGFTLGWLRTVRFRAVRLVASGWVESIRGTPLLVQLLFLFSVLSFYNPGGLAPTTRLLLTGFLALLINTSAYQAEIFRAGLQSVPAEQVEAAKSVGLSYWGAMRHVILPQAIRIVVPPLTNEFILLLKGSSLLSIVGVHELTFEGRTLSFVSGNFIEVYTVVTALYLLMTLPLAKGIGYLERRYRIPGLGLHEEPSRRRRAGRRGGVRAPGAAPEGTAAISGPKSARA